MPTMFVRQRVAHFAQWKAVFDGMEPARSTYGLTVTGIYRSDDDTNVVLIILESTDLTRAREFARSAVLNKGRSEALAGSRTQAEVWFSDDKMGVA